MWWWVSQHYQILWPCVTAFPLCITSLLYHFLYTCGISFVHNSIFMSAIVITSCPPWIMNFLQHSMSSEWDRPIHFLFLYRSDLPLLSAISFCFTLSRSSVGLQNHPHPDRPMAVSGWSSHPKTLQLLYQGLCQSWVGSHTVIITRTHTHAATHTQHTCLGMHMHHVFLGILSVTLLSNYHDMHTHAHALKSPW